VFGRDFAIDVIDRRRPGDEAAIMVAEDGVGTSLRAACKQTERGYRKPESLSTHRFLPSRTSYSIRKSSPLNALKVWSWGLYMIRIRIDWSMCDKRPGSRISI
jgi:hypothetical protein